MRLTDFCEAVGWPRLHRWDTAVERVRKLQGDAAPEKTEPATAIFTSVEASRPWLRQLYQDEIRVGLLKFQKATGWRLMGAATNTLTRLGYAGLAAANAAAASYLATLSEPDETEEGDRHDD